MADEIAAKADALMDQGKILEALGLLEPAVNVEPQHLPCLFLFGKALGLTGDHHRAVEVLERVAILMPNELESAFTLAVEYGEIGRYQDGLDCLEGLLLENPDLPLLHRWQGVFLRNLGRLDEAAAALGKALGLQPDYIEASVSLADVFLLQRRVEDAQRCLETLVEADPEHATALNDLARIYRIQGKVSQAARLFKKALEMEPGKRSLASNYLMALLYDDQLTPEFVASEHVRLADELFPSLAGGLPPVSMTADARLRIGYVSGDFRNHAVSFFVEPILACHDRSRFQIFCYSNADSWDETTARLKGLDVVWRDLYGVPAEQAAEMVRFDSIHILVDLSGQTAGNRLDLFALKPAPVQAAWVGYPHSSGLSQMDYYLSDGCCDPAGMTEHLYREQLWRLPRVFSTYYPPLEFPPVAASPCERTGVITFGCYNNFAKINDAMIQVWCRILSRVPGSRLCLKSVSLGGAELACQVYQRFSQHGIGAGRIVLHGFVQDPREHLAHYEHIDIALDTYPYHGTTTTCEALWMGVPVIVLAGRSHVSRVGVSLLAAVGLTRFLADSPEEYESLAVELASDRQQLCALRGDLRSKLAKSAIMDAYGVTRELEEAYTIMMERMNQ